MTAVFDLVLEHPDTHQKRHLTLAAEDEQAARADAEARETEAVQYSLDIPDKDYWESPPGQDPHDPDGLVDLSRWDAYDKQWATWASTLTHAEAARANERRLSEYIGRMQVVDGKVVKSDVGKRTKGRVLLHLQDKPYEIAEVTHVDPATIDRERAVGVFREALLKHDPRTDPRGWEPIIEALKAKGIHTAAVTAQIHGVGVLAQDAGGTPIVWGTSSSGDTIKTALCTALTNNPDTQDFWDDVVGTEITGTGYTTLGFTETSKAVSYDTATDQTRLDGADASWTTSTLSATDAVIFKTTGTASTSPIYGSIDFGATVTTTAGTFQITWDATGIIVRDYT